MSTGDNLPSPPASVAAMERNGAYNRHSSVQRTGAAAALPMLARAAASIGLPGPSQPVVIADYGCSQGINSFEPMRVAIRSVRERSPNDQPISIVHTDLPDNDFSSLFLALASDPKSYLATDARTFASAIGRSFYEQIIPDESVALGWSAWAVQWMSRAPTEIPDHVQVACSADPNVREQFARQAAEDWESFLRHRGREIRSEGRLVVVTMAKTDDGEFGYGAVLSALYGALQTLVIEGLLHAHELRRMAIPTFGRSRSDLVKPFLDGTFAGFEVVELELILERDLIWDDFRRDRDAASFGRRWAAFSRASVMPTLALGLDGGAADKRGALFLDRLEDVMARDLAAKPAECLIPLVAISLRKR